MKYINYFFVNKETSKNKKYSSVLNAQLSTKKLVENPITYTDWFFYENFSDATYLVKRFASQYYPIYEIESNGLKFYASPDTTGSFIHLIASKTTKKLTHVKMKLTHEDFIKLDKTIFDGFDQLDPNRQISVRLVHGVDDYTVLELFLSKPAEDTGLMTTVLNLFSSKPAEDTSLMTYQAMTDLAHAIYQFPSYLHIEVIVTFTC